MYFLTPSLPISTKVPCANSLDPDIQVQAMWYSHNILPTLNDIEQWSTLKIEADKTFSRWQVI